MNHESSFFYVTHDLIHKRCWFIHTPEVDAWSMVQSQYLTLVRKKKKAKLRSYRPVGYAAGKNETKNVQLDGDTVSLP